MKRLETYATHWWDEAVDIARRRASITGRRFKVYAWMGYWCVSEAEL